MSSALRPFEDFVWYAGKTWLYEGTADRSGRVLLAHPFDASKAVSAPRSRIRKVSKDEKVAILAAIEYLYERKTDPRYRKLKHNPRRRNGRRKKADFVFFDLDSIVALSPRTWGARHYTDTKLRLENYQFRGEVLVMKPAAAKNLMARLQLAGFSVEDSDV